ncbi:MAG: hypothetical protein NTY80_05040 [candidate division SR1 bacterium]|nr:hypothetical protein [candidate division SR1 bacterium]
MARQIIIGLLVAGIGGAVIYFSGYIADMFGNIAWFDRNLGGTRSGFVLSGFIIMIIGFLVLFGMIPTGSPTQNLPSLPTPTNQSSPATQ